MYYSNISNSELQGFRNLMVHNFTIKLSDVLTSDLFIVEEVVMGNIYKIYPLFYTRIITSSNVNDKILDNRCIICQKQDDKETYLTFVSNENDEILDYQSNANYFDISDSLNVNQYNMIVSLLRRNIIHTDTFNIIDEVNGSYGKYLFNIDGCTVIDEGIVIDEDTKEAKPTIKLIDNTFHYSTYTLQLSVMHYTGVNILDDVSPSDFIVVDTMELELLPNKEKTIPLDDLEDGYIISINTQVKIEHDKPVIQDWVDSIILDCKPNIIQKTETSELYATGYDNGGVPVSSGHEIFFFEKIMPTLSLTSSNPIIQSGEKSNIKSKLYDSDDGSIISGERIDFYEVYTPNIRLRSDNPIIQSGEKSNVKATLIDSEDGSLISGERIDFYEIYTPSVVVSSNNPIIQVGDVSQLSAKVKDSDGSLVSDEVVYFYVVEED